MFKGYEIIPLIFNMFIIAQYKNDQLIGIYDNYEDAEKATGIPASRICFNMSSKKRKHIKKHHTGFFKIDLEPQNDIFYEEDVIFNKEMLPLLKIRRKDADIAKQLGISVRTLYRYKAKLKDNYINYLNSKGVSQYETST